MCTPVSGIWADAFQYKPLIDDQPITTKTSKQVRWDTDRSGFTVGSFGGLYLGSASSFLSPDISSLDRGTHPMFGLSIGYRVQGSNPYQAYQSLSLARRFEFTLKWALGLGQTYERSNYDNAFDHMMSPLLTFHLFESKNWGVATDVGSLFMIYDLEEGEVSQITLGSHLALKFIAKLSHQHHLYITPSWNYLYDFSAYSFRDPTEKELEKNPKVLKFKVNGAWFHLYQVIIGYQLLNF